MFTFFIFYRRGYTLKMNELIKLPLPLPLQAFCRTKFIEAISDDRPHIFHRKRLSAQGIPSKYCFYVKNTTLFTTYLFKDLLSCTSPQQSNSRLRRTASTE